MNHQEELQHRTGEIDPPESAFEGRYDNEEPLHSLLLKAYALRKACQAVDHALGKLDYNASTNIMTCGHCSEEMDMNELVSPELRVKRVA